VLLTVPMLALAVLAGCRDFLVEEPKDQLTTENFYQTEADARAAIAATYRPLSDGPLFGTAMKSALIIAADHARAGVAEENEQIRALSGLAWDAATPRVTDPWFGWYDIVTQANLLLEKLPGTQMSEAARTQIVGEAKFLRALGYFYLVRLYGDVPLVTTTEQQVGQPSRTPKAEVFAQILKDAQEAEAALPVSWDPANKGRAPKGAAQASSAANAPTIRSADMFYPREMVPNAAGGFASMIPLQWHLDSYAPGDYRYEVTYFTRGRLANGREVTFTPHVYKYRPTSRPGPLDVNWPIYRYAEVLLFYAEALNELGRTTEAVQYLDQVRARARLGTGAESRPEPANYSGPLAQSAVRDTIFEERRIETAFECDRWFDLVRRGPDFFQQMLARDPLATDVQLTDMLWPIPQREINVNPNLTQNPGY
jgi:hypothetical protein